MYDPRKHNYWFNRAQMEGVVGRIGNPSYLRTDWQAVLRNRHRL
jgi:hypothetical protein